MSTVGRRTVLALEPATYDSPVPLDDDSAARVPPGVVSERSIGLLVVLAAFVAAVSGVVLADLYRPHQWGWLRAVHAGSAAVAVISAIAARVLGTGGRLRMGRRRALVLVGTAIVLGGAFATGSTLAWTGGAPADRGVFLASGHRVLVGDSSVSSGSLLAGFLLHAALGVCAFVVLAGRYVRPWWRQRGNRR